MGGRTVFFANHHGPLPVNTGGLCGGRATALNIVKMIAQKMKPGDIVIMGGDFNSGVRSSEIRELDKHLVRVFTALRSEASITSTATAAWPGSRVPESWAGEA